MMLAEKRKVIMLNCCSTVIVMLCLIRTVNSDYNLLSDCECTSSTPQSSATRWENACDKNMLNAKKNVNAVVL